MSFRLGSFIQAVTEQTYLDVKVAARVVPPEGADINSSSEQAEDDGSSSSSDDALEPAQPKA
jgi:hypothetical protein